MAKKPIVEPNPAYMGCAIGLTKDNLAEKLLKYERSNWCAEEKLDGRWNEIRIKDGKVFQLISRNGIDEDYPPLLTHEFPKNINGTLIGESSYGSSCPKMLKKVAVIYDFKELTINSRIYDATVMDNQSRFDLLEYLNCWDSSVDLVERKYSNFLEMYQRVLGEGGEGIILKKCRGEDTYLIPGSRSDFQIKVKKETEIDYVVMGLGWRNAEDMSELTKSKGQERWIKEITVGLYRDGKLTKSCRVGSMEEIARKWFSEHPDEALGKIVVVRGYGQFEKTGATRHPSLVVNPDGTFLRTDIRPEDCSFGKIRYL